MKDEVVTDALLRQFLLGQVDDAERQRIESLFITDSLIRERILVAEQDLIEEYLDDSLAAADRKAFVAQYADDESRQRQLRIAKTINDWAAAETIEAPSRPSPSIWSRLSARFSLKPRIGIPIAVAAAIALIFAAVWLSERIQRDRHHRAIEQEIARLNAGSQQVAAGSALTLAPVSLRGAAPSELTKRAGVDVVELRLTTLQSESSPSYRAVVRGVGDEMSFTIPDLHIQPGKVIPIKLPAYMLTRGTHQVELSGLAADGSVNSTEEYRFTVRE